MVGTLLYKLYSYVPPHRVGFLRRFGLKTGIHFDHFCLESGMVFEGTTGVKEREICEFKMDLKNLFVCALIDCEQSLVFLCKVTAHET